MTDSDHTAFSPGPNATPGVLLGGLPGTKPLAGDPRGWEPPTPEALQAQLHGYEVQQFVARGGMGAVYRGVQTSLGRQVAIKILPPELRDADPQYAERFKQEARAMAQLNHPAIVSVYDFGEMADGTFYFIMEFIEGTDVGQMVAQQGRLASAHAMAITAHVCDALQYAHERGIVHRDIKPANIMVGFDGRVKVADFGLAKSFRQVDTGLTQSGFVMGTPHFVAPEAMIMGVSVDHRADIYAVGVMLYQMLTGKLPQGLFEMPSLQVPGLDPRYDAIVSSAMRENRDQRYQHIIDMRRALDAIVTQPVQKPEIAGQTVPATVAAKPVHQPRPGGPSYRAPQPAQKEKSSAGWIAAVFVTAMVVGSYAFLKSKPPPIPTPLSTETLLPQNAKPVPAKQDDQLKKEAIAAAKPANPASQPSTPQTRKSESEISVDQPVTIKLEFANAEKYYDVGGYQPIEVSLSKSAPRSISKAPTGLASPLYGELKLGPPASQRTHAIILNHPKTENAKLYIDGNANGDITDDPPAKWQPGQQSNIATKAKWDVFQGEFMAEFKHADGIHPARFEVFQNTSASSSSDSLWIHPQYGRVGSVNLNGKSIKALLYDDGAKGDFSAPSSTFRLDLNGDNAFRVEQSEVFSVSQPFTVHDVSYQLSGLKQDGVLFQIIPSMSGKQQPSSSKPQKNSTVAPETATAEFRSFTNTKGQSIRAALVKISGDDIVLHKEDGTDYTLKAATLSVADIEYLKTQGLVLPQEPVRVVPEESKSSTLQHTMIFGLSRTDASSILADARLKSNPKAVLETVQGMVAGKRATLVSNLSVSSKFGNRSRVEAAYGCESEVTVKADGSLNAMFAITSLRSPASPMLVVSDIATKRGDVCFLGSFDDNEPYPKMPGRLVFVTFH